MWFFWIKLGLLLLVFVRILGLCWENCIGNKSVYDKMNSFCGGSELVLV